MASLPIELHKVNKNNAPIMIDNDYRLKLLNLEPNSNMNGFNLKQKIAKDIVLHGESVLVMEKVASDSNVIDALYPLSISKLIVNLYTNNGFKFTPEYQYSNSTGTYILDEGSVINIIQDSDNGVTGRGVLDKGEKVLSLAMAQHEYENGLMANGAMPTGVLNSDKKINKAVMQNLKDQFNDEYSGNSNVGKTIVLEDGMTYKQVSVNPDKLQLDTSKRAMLGEIARLFNLPETMINSGANKYNSNEQNNIQFFQFCLKPLLEAICSALNKCLLLESEKESGMYFSFNTDSIFQNTLEEKVSAIGGLFDTGLMSFNEARNRFGLDNTKQDDFYKFSLGSVFVDRENGQLTIPNTYDSKNNTQNEVQNTSKGGESN